jgi:hypothetical protein
MNEIYIVTVTDMTSGGIHEVNAFDNEEVALEYYKYLRSLSIYPETIYNIIYSISELNKDYRR